MILVTGASGLVGSHLIHRLIDQGKKVRALYRRERKLDTVRKVFSYYTSNPEELFDRIEWIQCDINDIPALTAAFKDIEYVYHCAAFVSFEPDKYNQLRKINIEGTANIVNLCISNKVKKLCYVSSIAALGHTTHENVAISEETKWDAEADNSVYAITKYGAEIEVWRGTQEGVDAVIVNPGVIIGPGFWRGGSSSALIRRVYNGMSHYTTGTTGFVDVNDVISIMTSLMKSDIINERFVLVSETLSYKKFIELTSEALGVKPPKKEATNLLLGIGWRLDWLKNKLLGKRRMLSKQMADSLTSISDFDNSKIKEALDYKFLPIRESVKNTSEYFLLDLKNKDASA